MTAALELRSHPCPVKGCERYVRGHLAFCSVHWACLSRAHKLAVTTALRAAGGDPKARTCAGAIQLAVEALAVARTPSTQQVPLPGVQPVYRSRVVGVEELAATAERFGQKAPVTAADVEDRRRRRECDTFNAACPVGAPVVVESGFAVKTLTPGRVTTQAQPLPTGELVVWVDGVRWPLAQVRQEER